MKYAVIDNKNIVQNIIEYDPQKSKWQPPADCYIVRSDIAHIGDWYDKEGNRFLKPELL